MKHSKCLSQGWAIHSARHIALHCGGTTCNETINLPLLQPWKAWTYLFWCLVAAPRCPNQLGSYKEKNTCSVYMCNSVRRPAEHHYKLQCTSHYTPRFIKIQTSEKGNERVEQWPVASANARQRSFWCIVLPCIPQLWLAVYHQPHCSSHHNPIFLPN